MTTAGIDFGTTNSVVSIWTSDGPEVLPMDEPPGDWAQLGFDKVVPTVISIDDDSTTEFGWAAKTGALPALEAVKRLMRFKAVHRVAVLRRAVGQMVGHDDAAHGAAAHQCPRISAT